MNSLKLLIPDIILFEPRIFVDDRGFFFESYNHSVFEKIVGKKVNFVQDNHSKSHRGVIRGLHYQLSPKSQGKLVRVLHGEIFDVAVDIRKNSPTFGKWIGEILSAENKKQIWIPEGFAHGFLTLSDTAELLYKATDYWAPEYERCILWNDPEINIKWPEQDNSYLSVKDKLGLPLVHAEVFFES